MPDFWPITPPVRSAVMTHTVDCAVHEQNERHALAAIRLLVTASALNLRARLLPRTVARRPDPPLGTRAEYEDWLRSYEDYMNYRHDWRVHHAGYPEGHVLKWLEFPIHPGVTPATLPDRTRRAPRQEDPCTPKPGPPWDQVDLWPIRAELREPVMHRLLRFIAHSEERGIQLQATRVMLSASGINLRFNKAKDIAPPPAEPEPWPEGERDFRNLMFADSQYSLFTNDRDMFEDGQPRGETFRWEMSQDRISDEHLVDWEKVNHFLKVNDLKVAE